ncbi:DUF1761 domain-containing protein [Candidatus Woesearchaeota archaeon]|nr:DUF1761 domain-containing protein [Candidatus Woesearchaeota archaeon]
MATYTMILMAAVAGMVIGGLWYSPLLFAQRWVKASGLSPTELEKAKQKGMGKTFLMAFVNNIIMAYILSLFVPPGITEGIRVAFLLWLGFIATTSMGSVLWERKPIEYYLINASHELVAICLMGAILAV